mmetsp:Transcript_15129/g.48247  ORF Transcript_15129/g.48247 Transcript_15129/m.48247 type:complete len:451 (+) Transcript_15129:1-1353(+)
MDVLRFARELDAVELARMYKNAWSVQVFFQALPPISQQYILRLSCVPVPVPVDLVDQWCHSDEAAQEKHREAILVLDQFRLLERTEAVKSTGARATLRLVDDFRKSLQSAMGSGAKAPWEKARKKLAAAGAVVKPPQLEVLDQHARGQWTDVLRVLVGAQVSSAFSGRLVVDLLLDAGFATIVRDRGTHRMQVLQSGWAFLLKPTHEQLRILLMHYFRKKRAERWPGDAVLSVLFMLSFCVVGTGYPRTALSELESRVLDDLAGMGLALYADDGLFYPTHLGVNVMFGGGTDAEQSMQLYVETNFRLYAYVKSSLDVHLLKTFAEIKSRLPQFVVARLCRESVHAAYEAGITPKQLISFLESYSHPNAKRRLSIVPEDVKDQLYLWERERHRIKSRKARLLIFEQSKVYEAARHAARMSRALLWSSDAEKRIVVAEEGYREVKLVVQSME